jgi:uncharacterized membrane protein
MWITAATRVVARPMVLEAYLRLGTTTLAMLAEAIGGAIIGLAVLRAAFAFLRDLVTDRRGVVPKEAIRLTLGRSLALALEFLLGADILRTAVAPGWQEIGQLAAIAVIRTFLNYFLQHELDSAAARAEVPPIGPPSG